MANRTATRYFFILTLALGACSNQQSARVETSTPLDAPTQAITIAPRSQLQKPAEVLADVTKNYTEATTDCREYGTGKARGHYYCSGVLVRTVDDGNFNPWMYSPTSLLIGASSYSWMRTDVQQTTLYHPAGFILRNRIDAIAHALPGLESGFVCLYPFDAGTSTANGHKGCGYRGKRLEEASSIGPYDDNSAYAWGSCNGIGITTASQWNAHFNSVGNVRTRQCSWNIDSQHGWNNMIASRRNFPNFTSIWNEILLNNFGDGAQMPKYISAFFYDVSRAGGLVAAQRFQTKMKSAGYNVPILRVNFNAAAASRFTYVTGDQVVPQ
jgi:hypothetical protein